MTDYDQMARDAFKTSKNMVIPWILLSSYSYYILHRGLLEDTTFDNMCKYLFDNWDSLDHVHKYLIQKEDMQNGSLYHLKAEDYPSMVRGSALKLMYEGE